MSAPRTGARPPRLRIENLTVHFDTDEGVVEAVNDLSMQVAPGEAVGLVGESGSGKSVTAQSVLRLVPRPPARVAAGRILFNGDDLLTLPPAQLRQLRGAAVGMIFQEPMTALSPLHRIGRQLDETLRLHTRLDRRERWEQGAAWLEKAGLPNARECMRCYPHQLSGGMRQRVMIAMAAMLRPQLIIADEPSTALDVTVQAQIFKLLLSLRDEDTALLLITHDMAVVWETCDRVYVMKNSRLVEDGPTERIFSAPAHDYTRTLLRAAPRLYRDGERAQYAAAGAAPGGEPQRERAEATSQGERRRQPGPAPGGEPLVEIRRLRVWFPIRRGLLARTTGHVKAVDDVDLVIGKGAAVGLVGESGCGKTTLGRAIIGLQPVNGGAVFLGGNPISGLRRRQLKPYRRDMQMIFQDPYSSLNPRMTIMDLLTEGLAEHGLLNLPRKDKAVQLLEEVELKAAMVNRYPFEFSGGERQRLNIARALSLEPRLIVADEAVSALDVTIQAQIIELLMRLQAKYGIACLFISHDLSVVRQLAGRIAVMRQGKIVEQGCADEVILNPQHAYTRDLLEAVPVPGDLARRRRMRGERAA